MEILRSTYRFQKNTVLSILSILLLTSLIANGVIIYRTGYQLGTNNPSEKSVDPVRTYINRLSQETVSGKSDEVSFLNLSPIRSARDKGAVDVILVVIDTARADYLQPYHSSLPTSPFLSAIAREGITFSNAYSTSSWTVPSMHSMMTGLYPSQHGITHFTMVDGSKLSQPLLPDEAVTLAEMMKENGYSTFGVSTNLHLTARFGFDQGFDTFVGDRSVFKPFPRIAVDSMESKIRNSGKYFLWLHYFDAHFPYYERAPWFSQWNDSAFKSVETLEYDAAKFLYRSIRFLEPQSPIPPEDVTLLTDYAFSLVQNPFMLYFSLPYLNNKQRKRISINEYIKYLQATYRSELRSIDDDMERLLEGLGIDDQTLIIVTADHGEEFFDHRGLGHHRESLYQELIRIPLIIRLPYSRHRGKVIHTPVSIIDLFPSLLELLDIPIPEGLRGKSFVSLIEGGNHMENRDIISELSISNGMSDGISDGKEVRSLIRYPWKLIYHIHNKRSELYNIHKDPKEQHNLIKKEFKRANDMKKQLVAWSLNTTTRWNKPKSVSLSPEEIKKLSAMGYIAKPKNMLKSIGSSDH